MIFSHDSEEEAELNAIEAAEQKHSSSSSSAGDDEANLKTDIIKYKKQLAKAKQKALKKAQAAMDRLRKKEEKQQQKAIDKFNGFVVNKEIKADRIREQYFMDDADVTESEPSETESEGAQYKEPRPTNADSSSEGEFEAATRKQQSKPQPKELKGIMQTLNKSKGQEDKLEAHLQHLRKQILMKQKLSGKTVIIESEEDAKSRKGKVEEEDFELLSEMYETVKSSN